MVTDGPLPMSLRSNPHLWAGCVYDALPEREYLDLAAHAGFREIQATRSELGGEVEGVRLYSLSVAARKGQSAACTGNSDGACASADGH